MLSVLPSETRESTKAFNSAGFQGSEGTLAFPRCSSLPFTDAGTAGEPREAAHPLLTRPVGLLHRLYLGVPDTAALPPQGQANSWAGSASFPPITPPHTAFMHAPSTPASPLPTRAPPLPTRASPHTCPPAPYLLTSEGSLPPQSSAQLPADSTPSSVPSRSARGQRMSWCSGLSSQDSAQTGLPLTPSKAGYLSLNSPKYNESENQRSDPWGKPGLTRGNKPLRTSITDPAPLLPVARALRQPPAWEEGHPRPYTRRASHRKELRSLLNSVESRTKQTVNQ